MSNVFPRQNGKSTLALNYIRLQKEVNEANYNTYAEKVKNDLLEKENQQLKDDCRVLKTALNCHEDIRKGLYDKCERMENLLVECKFILEGVLNYPTGGLVSKISKELKK